MNDTTIAAVIADLIRRLAKDPELAAMAEVNDAERFVQGCRAPWFDRKVVAALADIRAQGVPVAVAVAAVEAKCAVLGGAAEVNRG